MNGNSGGGGVKERRVVVIVAVDVVLPLAAGITLAGASTQVEFAGAPVQLNVTVEAKPLREATVAVTVVVLPATTLGEAGATAIVKSGVDEVPVPVSKTV